MAVLSTKLHVPSARHRLVERPRLTSRLEEQMASARLLLVSAPAGFGKTTFLAQWLEVRGDAPAAWLSLDTGDNDSRRYLTALATAARTAMPGVGDAALTLLESSSQLPVEAALTSLVNALDRQATPSVFVLDDYHLLEDPSVHEATAFLLEHLPAHVAVAISSRVDPPLPLARLRSRGELLELRADDLRFTPTEAGSFLNSVMQLRLTEDDVAALETRTEGWVAGLQLAGLSVRGQSDPSGFIEAFAGSHRFVVDYLLEEVLRSQPEDVTRFLLDTVVLAQMTASLCDAVTGRTDSQQMLEALERNNMFIVPLDDQRHWYRYHHLFADALRARARVADAARAGDLHRRASDWFAANGQPEEAIGHALDAGDTERAADLVEQALPENRRGRGDRTLQLWLERMPDEVVRRRPVLGAFVAFTRLVRGDLDGAEAILDDAEIALEAMPPTAVADSASVNPELGRLRGTIEVYRASLAQARGDVEGTARHARRALEVAGPDDHLARSGGAGFLALSAWAVGDLAAAVETFAQTVDSLHQAGFLADELGTTVPRASMWTARGRPDTARRLYVEALEVADRQAAVLSTTGDLHVGLADALREHDDLDAAEHHLGIAHDLGDAASLLENRHRWFLVKAGVEQARGRLDAAVALVERAQELYLPGFYPDVRPVPAVLARLRVAQGRLDDAFGWVRAHDVTLDRAPEYLAEYELLSLARLLLAHARQQGDPGGVAPVLPLLHRLLSAAEAADRGAGVVEVNLLIGLAHHARHEPEPALDHLGSALALGVPVGFRRLFLDEGAPLVELLGVLERQRPALAGPARELRRPPPATHAGVVPSGPALPASEPLSERELDVLRLLETTMTGPDIARELYMSLNTFRTHTKHIFSKLDVNTRAAAVRRGHDLGVL